MHSMGRFGNQNLETEDPDKQTGAQERVGGSMEAATCYRANMRNYGTDDAELAGRAGRHLLGLVAAVESDSGEEVSANRPVSAS